jgi:DNA polymerase-3 subunit epsilon
MRELVLDTETTGLDPGAGHRIVEIAVVELFNHLPTGRSYHTYINPQRDMPEGAQAVHGLTAEFLAPHPVFALIADAFLDFIAADPLVIHNADFDLGFINAELARLDKPRLSSPVVDTLVLARRRFPGQPASLDALCRRFEIDLTKRDKHGALIDGELLAAVYLELIGGRQPGLDLASGPTKAAGLNAVPRPIRPARPHAPGTAELAAHEAFLAKLKQPIWKN